MKDRSPQSAHEGVSQLLPVPPQGEQTRFPLPLHSSHENTFVP